MDRPHNRVGASSPSSLKSECPSIPATSPPGRQIAATPRHGGPGYPRFGNDQLTPQTAPGTALLDQVAGFVRPGGTLVLTGCQVFGLDDKGQSNIGAWQQYATDHKITIMGSASDVDWSTGSVKGVWITLVPGGTAPTITP